MTVQKLIDLLKTFEPDEPIVFQFVVAEHTSYGVEQFEEIADFLEDSDSFGDDTARVLKNWCETAEYEIESQDA
jgi:protein-tyrosine phosphatase